MLLRDVAHVPRLSYYIFSLSIAADKWHKYTDTSGGLMVDFITGEKVFFPSVGRFNFLYAYRPNALVDETANVAMPPGLIPNNRNIPSDIDDFHVVYNHAQEGALRKTVKQIGVTFVGKMHECKGCSRATGIRISISSKTCNLALERRFNVLLVDLGGKKGVKLVGGTKYPMIIRDDYSCYTWISFIFHKPNAAD